MDMWTNVFASLGSRTIQNKKGSFKLVGPEFTGDLDSSTIRCPTRNGWLFLRIVCSGGLDYPPVWWLQMGFRLHPLVTDRGNHSLQQRVVDVPRNMTPPSLVHTLDAKDFFAYACEVMKAGNMPAATDSAIVKSMRSLGVVPGQSFNWGSLSKELQQSLLAEVETAKAKLENRNQTFLPPINGWMQNPPDLGNYSTNYALRAFIARWGLGANLQKDAVYMVNADPNLLGSLNFVLRFEAGKLPPVNGFWSVTLYDSDGYLVANKENRHALGDRSHLRSAADGSTTIYLSSKRPPMAEQQANWLPTPHNKAFSLTLRMYWAKPELLNGSWVPPPVKHDGSSPNAQSFFV